MIIIKSRVLTETKLIKQLVIEQLQYATTTNHKCDAAQLTHGGGVKWGWLGGWVELIIKLIAASKVVVATNR